MIGLLPLFLAPHVFSLYACDCPTDDHITPVGAFRCLLNTISIHIHKIVPMIRWRDGEEVITSLTIFFDHSSSYFDILFDEFIMAGSLMYQLLTLSQRNFQSFLSFCKSGGASPNAAAA